MRQLRHRVEVDGVLLNLEASLLVAHHGAPEGGELLSRASLNALLVEELALGAGGVVGGGVRHFGLVDDLGRIVDVNCVLYLLDAGAPRGVELLFFVHFDQPAVVSVGGWLVGGRLQRRVEAVVRAVESQLLVVHVTLIRAFL